jgi:aryl-alcohol dehydrogenase-like predicted oxidoreductase
MDEVAKNHNVSLSAVALAWLRAQPTVSVPIASARTVEQVEEIIQIVDLSIEEIQALNTVS